jgi:2-haloacid dehalogenase/putative hydrolase of the HAD superfamily
MYDALLLDFYGTLVAEDDAQIAAITARIAKASPDRPTARQISSRWNELFAGACAAAHGASFRTQREIELASLARLLAEFRAPLDPVELSAPLFAYWARPTPLADTSEFLRAVRRPICIVSNIDDADLDSALDSLGWRFARVVTSEQCRAYKPRGEMFAAALGRLGCAAERVLHVGDSIGSDLRGAAAAGIAVAWLNPAGRALPSELASPHHTVSRLSELAPLV